MGMGPHGESLLERVGRQMEGQHRRAWLEMERVERGEQRLAARIKWSEKHKKLSKPEAPVLPHPDKVKGQERQWQWVGETIESKGMIQWIWYTAKEIREAGFKVPRLKGKVRHGKQD